MARRVKAATKQDVPEGSGHCVEVEGQRVALFNVGGTYFAIDDVCTHEGGPLSEGDLEGEEVTCPWHNAIFNVRTGECQCPPADEDVRTFPIHVNGEDLEVELE